MPKPTIFILGSAHLESQNNGDLFTQQMGDMLNEKRQNEINSVIECLKKFKPTKIALEVLTKDHQHINQQFTDYLSGDFTLTPNEIYQIGFQLAKEMKHGEVFAVDWNEQVEGIPDLAEWSSEYSSREFEEVVEFGQRRMTEMELYFNTHTLGEYLRLLNLPEYSKKDHEIYMKLALMGDKNNPVGAMWTAQYWYYRNMIIYKNIVDLIDSDVDRIFVLYGAGHLHLLTQFLLESGRFHIVSAEEYLVQ